jgi:hypothetical protein
MPKVLLTFDQYILNPMGKNNAVLSSYAREAARRDYTYRFNNILLRENGKIDYYLYKDTKNNLYYALIRVPSEVVPKFYYDVVIKFFTDASVKESGRNLSKYYIQFFSNDPAFVFTYAHTFLNNGLMIKELAPKMSIEAINEKAVEKNPKDLVGYVKSIYFAYLYMKQRGLFERIVFDSAEEFDITKLSNNITDANTKIQDRVQRGNEISKKKKIAVDRATLRNIENIGINDAGRSRLVTTVSNVKTVPVKQTKPMNFVKTVKTVKTVKRK